MLQKIAQALNQRVEIDLVPLDSELAPLAQP